MHKKKNDFRRIVCSLASTKVQNKKNNFVKYTLSILFIGLDGFEERKVLFLLKFLTVML